MPRINPPRKSPAASSQTLCNERSVNIVCRLASPSLRKFVPILKCSCYHRHQKIAIQILGTYSEATTYMPSDTKLLLTKLFEIFFEKLRISRVISREGLSFPEILRAQIPLKIPKNNSQGIIFAIILCQRVALKIVDVRSLHRTGI